VSRARYIAQAGVIAALYAALTLLVIQNPLGYGPVQLRLSEAVTVVACLTPAAVPGLWVGSVAANAFMVTQVGVIGLLDVVFGSLGTLLGAAWTWRHRERPVLALAGPVVANALIVPAYLPVMLAGLGFYRVPVLGLDVEGSWLGMYAFGVVAVGLGQALVVYGLGLPLLLALKRLGLGRLLD
jgi:hypothetical protein